MPSPTRKPTTAAASPLLSGAYGLNSLLTPLLVFVLLGLWGCGAQQDTKTETETAQQVDTLQNKGLPNLGLPNPLQLTELIRLAGVEYEPKLTLSPQLTPEIATSTNLALLMGAYASDLGYNLLFNQKQPALDAYGAMRRNAVELQIDDLFPTDLKDDYETLQNNPDSLQARAAKLQKELRQRLTDNGRHELEVWMIVGGWLEALYLTARIYELQPNSQLLLRMLEERDNLDKLMRKLDALNSPSAQELRTQFQTLYAQLDSLPSTYQYSGAEVDSTSQTVRIDNQTKLETDQLNKSALVNTIRQLRATLLSEPQV